MAGTERLLLRSDKHEVFLWDKRRPANLLPITELPHVRLRTYLANSCSFIKLPTGEHLLVDWATGLHARWRGDMEDFAVLGCAVFVKSDTRYDIVSLTEPLPSLAVAGLVSTAHAHAHTRSVPVPEGSYNLAFAKPACKADACPVLLANFRPLKLHYIPKPIATGL